MGRVEEPWITRHRITVDEYHRMAEAGVLAPDARVELIEGEVVDMAPIGTRHWAAVSRLNHLLVAALGQRAIVSVQQSLRLDRSNEPEPDIAVLRWRHDFYATALPSGRDALLVIEVADTTAPYDVNIKAPLYARHGVPVYWVVDLRAGLLRVFAEAHDGAYAATSHTATPGRIALPGLEGVVVGLSDLLA